MYSYETEKPNILTDEGQRKFLIVRDHVARLLESGGAFMMNNAMVGSGSSWTMMAYIDRMVELEEIREITGSNVCGQNRVFVKVRATA